MRAYKCSIWPTKWQFPITVGIDDSLILSRTNIWGELKTKKIKWNFLCSQIQNEIIALIGDKVLDEIVRRVKKATFFSIIMDCTPDTSHTDNFLLSWEWYCKPSVGASISDHFVGFIDVQDTTGKGPFDTLLEKLDKFNLSTADCRRQSYDNGSNMMGHRQGVQARRLQLNEKALCVPCSSHTLNLVVADAAKSSEISSPSLVWSGGITISLALMFNTGQFSSVKEHVKQLTLKSLSDQMTRWEARIDSVVRYHLPEVIHALSVL